MACKGYFVEVRCRYHYLLVKCILPVSYNPMHINGHFALFGRPIINRVRVQYLARRKFNLVDSSAIEKAKPRKGESQETAGWIDIL